MRSLSPDEAELWARVTATIRPLSREPIQAEVAEPAKKTAPSASLIRPAAEVRKVRPTNVGTTLDSTWDRRLRSGSVEPDRVLDLHGMSLDKAWWAIDRALEGIKVTTVVHLCFGYAAVVPGQKPVGYSFLTELAACKADQISIEAAQPKLDLGILKDFSDKTIMLGVIDLGDETVETPQLVAERIRAALKFIDAKRLVPAPDCGMKYLSRETAFGKLKALSEGAAIVRRELQ